MDSPVADLTKLLKPRGFKEVTLCRATKHPSPCRHLWQKTYIFEAKAFYLTKNKLFLWLQTYLLVVHAHGVIFPWTYFLTRSFLTFTCSVFYFIKMFPVLNLNKKYFWFSGQLSVPSSCTWHWQKTLVPQVLGLLLTKGTHSLLGPKD
jgi:hypothetical protein